MDPVTFFIVFLKASILSSSGLGNLPSLHEDLIARHWAGAQDFAAALAVGQIAPGPSGLWAVSLGYLVAGWWGALLATLATLLPPLLILPIEALNGRYGGLPAVRDFVRGLSLAIVAIVPIVMYRVVTSQGADIRTLLIVVLSAAFGFSGRVPIPLILVLAAAAGIFLYR